MVKNISKKLEVIMRSICFVDCAVFTNKFVDPSK